MRCNPVAFSPSSAGVPTFVCRAAIVVACAESAALYAASMAATVSSVEVCPPFKSFNALNTPVSSPSVSDPSKSVIVFLANSFETPASVSELITLSRRFSSPSTASVSPDDTSLDKFKRAKYIPDSSPSTLLPNAAATSF